MVEEITSGWIGFNQANIGGYSTFERWSGTTIARGESDFVDNFEVLKKLQKGGVKKVHLAGSWKIVGRKGYGELVTLTVAKKLLKKRFEKLIQKSKDIKW